MNQPCSARVATWFLSGYFISPVLTVVIACVVGSPPVNVPREVDSVAADYVRGLFFAHLAYGWGLVIFLEGWRPAAIILGICSLPAVCIVSAWAWYHVTGVTF
jgi:hypothetical protein